MSVEGIKNRLKGFKDAVQKMRDSKDVESAREIKEKLQEKIDVENVRRRLQESGEAVKKSLDEHVAMAVAFSFAKEDSLRSVRDFIKAVSHNEINEESAGEHIKEMGMLDFSFLCLLADIGDSMVVQNILETEGMKDAIMEVAEHVAEFGSEKEE